MPEHNEGQAHTASHKAAPQPSGPEGFWLTDNDFALRLQKATLIWLELADNMIDDGFTLFEALTGAHAHAPGLLDLPAEYGPIVEAEAATQILRSVDVHVDSYASPATRQALQSLGDMPAGRQQQILRTAARRYASTDQPTQRITPVRPASPPLEPGPRRAR
ncbi:hypothetical protein BJP40_03955 [Streptomyces sp. CC53]|uniref:hypothetical protein n=1 Tax=Streptomyces sp. CC53 TaxID=1906740 RepID=UPI0008DDC236|nr:hypothetical protein [Streptomyces sp. CC53]OII62160.1 hypothetical protein BJP40_03955 [Streptomyces sp. CC53]